MKKYSLIFVSLVLIFFSIKAYSDGSAHDPLVNKKLVKDAVEQVFCNINATPEDVSTYFSPHYLQTADGHQLNYNEFLTHVRALHTIMKSIRFSFKEMISEGNIVASHHIVEEVKKNGDVVKIEFFAFLTIKDHKIIKCQESSRIIQGDITDKKLPYQH